ncbi:MAG: DsbA family protein [Pseudomonadota bacterium]
MTRSLILAISAFSVAAAACGQQQAVSPDRAATEEIIRSYLLENPEVIEEALIALQAQRNAEEAEASRTAILDNRAQLVNLETDYALGPEDAAVTVVEFFDYRCGPCRASMETVNALPERYAGQVRVVFKEFPILSPESAKAAIGALAAGRQGKYVEMHQALMRSPSDFTDDDIAEIAEQVGVDMDQWREDIEDNALIDQIDANFNLAQTIGANATPTFVIGDELFSGLNREKMERLISGGIARSR